MSVDPIVLARLERHEHVAVDREDSIELTPYVSQLQQWCRDDRVPVHRAEQGRCGNRKLGEWAYIKSELGVCSSGRFDHSQRDVASTNGQTPAGEICGDASGSAANVENWSRPSSRNQLDERVKNCTIERGFKSSGDRCSDLLDVPTRGMVVRSPGRGHMVGFAHEPIMTARRSSHHHGADVRARH